MPYHEALVLCSRIFNTDLFTDILTSTTVWDWRCHLGIQVLYHLVTFSILTFLQTFFIMLIFLDTCNCLGSSLTVTSPLEMPLGLQILLYHEALVLCGCILNTDFCTQISFTSTSSPQTPIL